MKRSDDFKKKSPLDDWRRAGEVGGGRRSLLMARASGYKQAEAVTDRRTITKEYTPLRTVRCRFEPGGGGGGDFERVAFLRTAGKSVKRRRECQKHGLAENVIRRTV